MSFEGGASNKDLSKSERPPKPEGGVKNHNKYRKPKPWDTDDIDHWKVDEWKPDFMPAPLLEESSFATLFPQYREKYLREVWPLVTAELGKLGIGCELNLIEGSMTVKTTRKAIDPYIILKSRDLLKLLARSVPVQQALKVLRDDVQCDIVKIGGTIVYSTCALSRFENDEIIRKLYQKRSGRFELIRKEFSFGGPTEFGWQVLPDTTGHGPFYLAVLLTFF